MRILYYLVLLAVVLLGATFATLNLQSVPINFYLAQRTMPLALLLALAFSGGGIFGFIIGFFLLLKSKLKQFRLRKRLNLIEKELENLRSIPLRDKP